MSDRSYASFLGLTKLRARLEQLQHGLSDAASGGVVQRAAEKIRAQVDTVAKKYAEKHQLSGDALGMTVTVVNGALVQSTTADYLRFHEWWPFRTGMPPFVLTNAVKTFAAELEAAISGKPSPLLLADEAAEEVAAVKSRAAFKRETARIFRRSAEGKAKKKAERKAFAETPEGKAKTAARKAASAAKKAAKGTGAQA